MKDLEARFEDRKRRKLENQGEEAVKSDAEAGFGRAGVGTVNTDVVLAGTEDGGIGNAGFANRGWPGAGAGGESGPLDGTIDSLTSHLEGVNDAAEIDRLIAAESGEGGKNRSGAISALEARKAALASA